MTLEELLTLEPGTIIKGFQFNDELCPRFGTTTISTSGWSKEIGKTYYVAVVPSPCDIDLVTTASFQTPLKNIDLFLQALKEPIGNLESLIFPYEAKVFEKNSIIGLFLGRVRILYYLTRVEILIKLLSGTSIFWLVLGIHDSKDKNSLVYLT